VNCCLTKYFLRLHLTSIYSTQSFEAKQCVCDVDPKISFTRDWSWQYNDISGALISQCSVWCVYVQRKQRVELLCVNYCLSNGYMTYCVYFNKRSFVSEENNQIHVEYSLSKWPLKQIRQSYSKADIFYARYPVVL